MSDKWCKKNKLCVYQGAIDMSCNYTVSAPREWVEKNCPELLTDKEYTYIIRSQCGDGKGGSIVKDEEHKRITVALPKAEIRYTDIDLDSFLLYGEKQGVGNRISVADFNDSLVELKQNAQDKALARGVLDRADKNAQLIVRNFVASLCDPREYTLVFEVKAS